MAVEPIGDVAEDPERVDREAAALDVRAAALGSQGLRRPRVEILHQHVPLDDSVLVRAPDALSHASGYTAVTTPAPGPRPR